MENQSNTIELLIERLEAYIKTTFELSKLKSLETTADVAGSVVSRLAVIIMFSLFGLVLNIGIALWLGECLGKSYYGFFVVAAFYLFAGIILNLFKNKWIKKPLIDLIIKQAFK